MTAKRSIIDTPNGPALVEEPPGVSVVPFQAGEALEISRGDKEWADMHKKLQTGELDFVKVKKEHGITEVQSN